MTVGEGADNSMGAACMCIGNHDNPMATAMHCQTERLLPVEKGGYQI